MHLGKGVITLLVKLRQLLMFLPERLNLYVHNTTESLSDT